MTSKWRRSDVITSHRRQYSVITRLCVCCDSTDRIKRKTERSKQARNRLLQKNLKLLRWRREFGAFRTVSTDSDGNRRMWWHENRKGKHRVEPKSQACIKISMLLWEKVPHLYLHILMTSVCKTDSFNIFKNNLITLLLKFFYFVSHKKVHNIISARLIYYSNIQDRPALNPRPPAIRYTTELLSQLVDLWRTYLKVSKERGTSFLISLKILSNVPLFRWYFA